MIVAQATVNQERIPHTRGGEPIERASGSPGYRVFPTRVGVNLYEPRPWGKADRVFPTRVGVNRH